MASPTPSLESRANSLGSLASLSPLTVSGSSPPASDSAICDVDTCDLCLDSQKPGEAPCPRCRLNGAGGVRCTGCKSTKSDAVARCFDCENFLCPNCVMAHQFMHCFEGHRVLNLGDSKLDTVSVVSNTGGGGGGGGSNTNGTVNGGTNSNGIVSNSTSNGVTTMTTTGGSNCSTNSTNSVGNNNGPISNNLVSNSQTSTTSAITNATAELAQKTNNLVMNVGTGNNGEKVLFCARHKQEIVKYFCRHCTQLVCKECTMTDHGGPPHDCGYISEVGPQQLELMARALQECRVKASDVRSAVKSADHSAARLRVQYHKAQNEVNETFQFYRSMLEERKQDLLKELEAVFSSKQMALDVMTQKANEMVEKIQQTCEFVERLTKYTTITEVLMVKKLLDPKLALLLNYTPDIGSQSTATDLEFVSNYQAIQVAVKNTFGYVRSSSENNSGSIGKQPPIARPTSLNSNSNGIGGVSNCNGSNGVGPNSTIGGLLLDRPYTNGLISSNSGCVSSGSPSPFDTAVTVAANSVITKRFSSANSLGPFSTTISDLNLNGMNANPYEKWSNGGNDSYPVVTNNDHFPMPSGVAVGGNSGGPPGDSVLDLTSKLIFPLKSPQINRQKMSYHCKFGEFGVMEGQFTEPSGVAVNAQNDIIVADTNNHRIQIFDKEGRFKFQFGECGKRDGQLLYPNRVAVVRTSGDIIVTERSPTHQIQIYNQYGQFVRKFGANILQHPRGVTVDSKGRIVVVECKVMRVIIFDQAGNVLQKFGCSKHLEFPNGVVVNDKQEIFISDNRAHCVKVFNYEGAYLRQIGGEGITNYPIGVGINAAGEILIADNHNNFNLTIFTQDGQLISALESKVKHAQCFDVALMDDGSVVLASKDYRLYIYRYVQVPPIGM